jgi:protein-disulfide isomerase
LTKILVLLAAAAALPLAACDFDKGANGNSTSSQTVAPVKPPANGDWSTVVTQTPGGGFLMGNPAAKVQLLEIGALTCPHCREFDETGAAPLIEKYVKTGKVGWEFRPYLLNGLDVPANLIVGCNGPASFFPLMRAVYKDQAVWIGKMQDVPPAQIEQVQNLPPDQQFKELANLTGLQEWAAIRGVPQAKSDQCLKDQARVEQLVQQTSDVVNQYPGFQGTPSFIINGQLAEKTATWALLEPKLKEALGE